MVTKMLLLTGIARRFRVPLNVIVVVYMFCVGSFSRQTLFLASSFLCVLAYVCHQRLQVLLQQELYEQKQEESLSPVETKVGNPMSLSQSRSGISRLSLQKPTAPQVREDTADS